KINAGRGRIVRWPQADIFALGADLTVAVAGDAEPHHLSSVDVRWGAGPKMVHLASSPGAWVTRAKAWTLPVSSAASVSLTRRWRARRDLPVNSADTISTRKWLLSVPGELRWPACRCDSLITSRRTGWNACVSFSRIVVSTDICTFFIAFCQDATRAREQARATSTGVLMAGVQRSTRSRNDHQRSSCARHGLRTYWETMKFDSK